MIAVDNEDPLVRHIQVVAGNRSLNGSGDAFRLEAADVPRSHRTHHTRRDAR